MRQRTTRPRGMVLFVVLGIITVSIIGIFAFTGFMRSQVHHEEQFILFNVGRSLAQSVVAYTHGFIQKAVNGDESGGFGDAFRSQVLAGAAAGGGSMDISGLVRAADDFDLESLRALIAETENPIRGGTPFSLEADGVSVTISGLQPALDDIGIPSPDMTGVLVIRAEVNCDERVITHEMKLRVKVINVQLPVLSKFTLAVFGLPSGAGSGYYNKVLVQRDGRISPSSPCQPLVLDNATMARELSSGGWVFLGAADMQEIHLNKAGGYDNYGEMFHFYDPGTGMPEPASIAARSAPTADPDFFGLFPGSEQYLAVLYNYWGYHEGMNQHDVFRSAFAGQDEAAASASSYFHLYGTKSTPSRTRVIGNVMQQVPYWSILATVNPSTGLGEYPITMLRRVDFDGFLDGFVNCFTYSDGTGNTISGASILGWPPGSLAPNCFFCGQYEVYKYFMSDFWRYPYNYNYEFCEYGPHGFDPMVLDTPRTFIDRHFLVSYDDFRMMDDGGKEYFRGRLDAFAGTGGKLREALRRKSVLRFANAAEFYATCMVDATTLKVPGVVLIEQGPLVIDRPVTLESGGIVALEKGDLVISRGIPESAAGPLILATLDGDVRIQTAAPIHASLLALAGSTAPSGGRVRASEKIKIKGSLACDRLSPEEMRRGGMLRYDPRLDPFQGPDLRVFLEDRDMRFEERLAVTP